ncbi:hypothetical protein H5410_005144 [Solanum commersonii]|uniref:Uncharacterized protein n=1 Tax=Solanum commersonii TaxID=4109 RepID=A0A9J6A5L5_SOLCO|nr:hypothetical protein H5410_005144 [Solanum commersonii]
MRKGEMEEHGNQSITCKMYRENYHFFWLVTAVYVDCKRKRWNLWILLYLDYTWGRGENHRSVSRIDRFLYSSSWEEQLTLIKQTILAKIGSDHNPIMLSCEELNFKKNHFKLESWWLVVEGLKEKGNWRQRKGDILNQLAVLEAIQEQRALTDDDAFQKSNLTKEFEEEGDNNTKYFHRIAIGHKRVNSIDNLKVEGVGVTYPKEIKEAIQQNYYKNL